MRCFVSVHRLQLIIVVLRTTEKQFSLEIYWGTLSHSSHRSRSRGAAFITFHLQFGWTPILRFQPAISEVRKIERLPPTSKIRLIVKACFDRAKEKLEANGFRTKRRRSRR